MALRGNKLNLLYKDVKPKIRLAPRLESLIMDLTPLYLPVSYPDAAFGVPSKVYRKEYAEKYLEPVGEILRCIEKQIFGK